VAVEVELTGPQAEIGAVEAEVTGPQAEIGAVEAAAVAVWAPGVRAAQG
jgi:hypothetical protein